MSAPLILKRGAASAPDDNNYEVLADGVVVGRIMRVAAAPKRTPWFWSLASDYRKDRTPTHGYEPTREAAMEAFARSWLRER
jgi:hypothetical protein